VDRLELPRSSARTPGRLSGRRVPQIPTTRTLECLASRTAPLVAALATVATFAVFAAFATGIPAAAAEPNIFRNPAGTVLGSHTSPVCTGACLNAHKASDASVQVVLTTGDLSSALSRRPSLRFDAIRPARRVPFIRVDPSVRYQRMKGFGAAMSDASAWLLYTQLTPAARAQAFNLLFGAAGIHLNYVRIPMGASDFTATGVPYSYDDMPPGQADPALAHFSIAHDDAYILPALREMLQVNPGVFTLANPWSPPPWMKANDVFDNVKLLGVVLPADYEPLAEYFVKFLQAYQAAGVPVDAVTMMNEPRSTSDWPGAAFLPQDEAPFLTEDLAPALGAAGLHPAVYAGDDANISDVQWMMASPAVGDLAGFAFHCYQGMGAYGQLHYQFPLTDVLENECSPGIIPYSVSEVAIDATRNWASGAQLWNLALNPGGGPVQPPDDGCHTCTGIVTVNQQSHRVLYGLNFYQLGQVSRYVQPGAVRIRSTRLVSDYASASGRGVTAGVDDVAFLNPDGSKALVAYNNSRSARTFALAYGGKSALYTLGPAATVTFTWR